MEHFWKAAKENPIYGSVIPLTLALHRIEKKYQDLAKPRIFVRIYDPDGFATGFDINDMYRGQVQGEVDEFMQDLNGHPIERIDEVMKLMEDEDYHSKISGMAFADRAEGMLYDMFKKADPKKAKSVDLMPPILERRYDDKGIPVAYKFNDSIVTVENGIIRVGGHTIELIGENAYLNDVLRRLFSGDNPN